MFGIKTIFNLRQYHSDNKETKGADLQLYHANMNTRRINVQHVIEALKLYVMRRSLFWFIAGTEVSGLV